MSVTLFVWRMTMRRIGWTVAIGMIALGNWLPVGAASFPPSVYPPPLRFPPWGMMNGCASLSGVRSPDAGSARAAFRDLARYSRATRLDGKLAASDQAMWKGIRQSWRRSHVHRAVTLLWSDVVRSGAGSRSPYAALIGSNCGLPLLSRSIWLAVCAKAPCYPAMLEHFYLLDRRGHWLVWFQYP